MPKFTILIPSFNREKYLEQSILSCLNQNFKSFELIISDDNSSDNTELMVAKYITQDKRIKYFKHDINKGMMQNFEEALCYVTGEYVIILGADDGLMPDSLSEIASIIDSDSTIDVLTWPTPAFFYAGTKMKTSQIVVPRICSQSISTKKYSTYDFIKRQSVELAYVGDPLCPMLYVKSIVKYSLINKVKDLSGGKFFSCSTPDGYSAFALCSLIDNYHFINKPMTLHGVSPSSAGVNYVKSNKNNDLSSKFFEDNKKVNLNTYLGDVPYSPLISIMTADFILTSQEKLKPNYRPTVFPDIKLLLNKAADELCDGLFEEKKINRELIILKKIAHKHNLQEYFDNLLYNSRRNFRTTLEGDAISPRLLYLNSSNLAIENINQASFFISKNILTKKFRFSSPFFLLNSFIYYLRGKLSIGSRLSKYYRK